MRSLISFLGAMGRIGCFVILAIMGIVAFIIGIIFAGYIILYVLGVVVGITIITGIIYLLIQIFK